jgi:hypothetical protein
MNKEVLIARHEDEDGRGLVIEKSIDCKTIVVAPDGESVEPIDYDGVNYLPCSVGDKVIVQYNKNNIIRTFKVIDIERSGHFFVCEIIYDEDEMIELELLALADQVEVGDISTNKAHLKADELIISLLYRKGLVNIADAYNKVPKYYE